MIASKLRAPSVQLAIPRARLGAALRKVRSPIVWLMAPAGAGKTTGIAEFLASQGTSSTWYRCGPDDRDAANLVGALSLALGFDRELETPRLIAHSDEHLRVEAERIFSAVLGATGARSWLVVDDAHHAEEGWQFRSALAGLFEAWTRLAGAQRIVLCSRNRPPAHFARLVVDGSMAVLEPELLMLDEGEAAALLGLAHVAHGAPGPQARSLLDASQGWTIAAAALAREQDTRSTRELGRTLHDYVSCELLSRLPVSARHALGVLAWLPTFGAVDLGKVPLELDFSALSRELERAGIPLHHDDAGELQLHAIVRDAARAEGASWLRQDSVAGLRHALLEQLAARRCYEELTALVELLSAHEVFASLLERDALALTAVGRLGALDEALRILPPPLRASRPWLVFWTAICTQARDMEAALRGYQAALERFQSSGDLSGQRVCAAALTHATLLAGDDLRACERWANALALPPGPNEHPAIEAMATSALLMRRAYLECGSPAAQQVAARAMKMLRPAMPGREALAVCAHCVLIYAHVGRDAQARAAYELGRELFARAPLDSAVNCSFIFSQIYYLLSRGELSEAVACADRGVRLAESEGAVQFVFNLAQAGAFAALLLGERDMLERFTAITQREALLRPARWNLAATELLQGWRRFEEGALEQASDAFRRTLAQSRELGFDIGCFHAELGEAFVRAELCHRAACEQALQRASELAERLCAASFVPALSLARAYLTLQCEEPDAARQQLRDALRQLQAAPALLTPVSRRVVYRIVKAAHSLELACPVSRWLQLAFRLDPPRDDLGPHWCWPVTIRCLGKFEVECTGLSGERVCNASSLAMLKLLIAADGEPVDVERIMDALWRSSKSKRSAFDTALHRLRRYLGVDTLVVVRDGKVVIDRARLWVDAWTLDTLAPPEQPTRLELTRVEASLLALYRGPFCDGEQLSSLGPARMRHARTFARLVMAVAAGWRGLADDERALAMLERGLEDPHVPAPMRAQLQAARADLSG